MALMTLGLFVFELKTAPLASYDRFTEQRWSQQDRTGAAPSAQSMGPGEDSLSLDGVLAPGITGGTQHLDTLRNMMAKGKAWILVSGTGAQMGAWYIESVSEKGSFLLSDGTARKVEFSVRLARYWDEDPAGLGNLRDSQ